MTKPSMAIALLWLACSGCFADPTLVSECPSRICGEIGAPVEDDSVAAGGAASSTQSSAAQGGAGGGGGGEASGGNPGAGGEGPSPDALEIAIVSPGDGEAFNHGEWIIFEAVVTTAGPEPAWDQIVWSSDKLDVFGEGYWFEARLLVVGKHEISVAVMDGGVPIATDSITLDAL